MIERLPPLKVFSSNGLPYLSLPYIVPEIMFEVVLRKTFIKKYPLLPGNFLTISTWRASQSQSYLNGQNGEQGYFFTSTP